jgi:hypothetical protein
VLIDLAVKSLADVGKAVFGRDGEALTVVPELEAIEQVEACRVSDHGSRTLLVGTKEDGSPEDSLKALGDAPEMEAILG